MSIISDEEELVKTEWDNNGGVLDNLNLSNPKTILLIIAILFGIAVSIFILINLCSCILSRIKNIEWKKKGRKKSLKITNM
jgi:hypothetical protein